MIAGLKERFVGDVESGAKRHTIRKGKRWRVGMRIDLYCNVRQKSMRLIFRAPVTVVREILIEVNLGVMGVWMDGIRLDPDEETALAKADGFEDFSDMYRFWYSEHGLGRFEGQIIHWDYERRSAV